VRPGAALWIVGALVVLVVAAAGYMAWRMSYVPADLDYSTTRLSENGVFRAAYEPRNGPIAINSIHTWNLHVETADGQPVEGAEISVDGGMPQHGHGLPTQPRVTRDLGGGNYVVEGMKFQMTGWWVVKFTVNSGGQTDTTVFNLNLR
jgi:hypothetical protein